MTLESSLFCEWDWSSAGMATIKNFTVTEGHTCSSIIENMTSSSAGHVFGFIPGCAEVSHFASLEFQCLIIIIIYFIFICLNRGGAGPVQSHAVFSAFTSNGMQMRAFQVVRWFLWLSCFHHIISSWHKIQSCPPPPPPFLSWSQLLKTFQKGGQGVRLKALFYVVQR